MRRLLPAVVLSVLFSLPGCDPTISYLADIPFPGPDAGTPTDLALDVPSPDGVGEVSGPSAVGLPCAADEDCDGLVCATTEALAAVGLSVAVQGGLCTALACGSDAACGTGGACVGRTTGFSLCAKTCDSYVTCRYAQGYSCARLDVEGVAACAPSGAVALAHCGDGVCDLSERSVAAQCAADCPDPLPAKRPVGMPCAIGTDCETGMCLTGDILAGFGLAGLEVPNGMCSKLPCTTDEECGEGGSCFDSSPFSGSPIKLCLNLCDHDEQCRYGEGYVCFGREAGGEGPAACLPGGIAVAIRCGDGVCDESEKADPTICTPAEDCP